MAREKTNRTERVDHWVRELIPGLTGRQVDEAVERGLVLGPKKEALKKGNRVQEAEINLGPLKDFIQKVALGNRDLKVPIVLENPSFWIIDKPAGMPSHPLSLFDTETVTQWAFATDSEIAPRFTEIQPTIVPHRLDTGTSGLLVVCRTPAAYEIWRGFFKAKKVSKKYLAWVYGTPSAKDVLIEDSIAHAPGDDTRMVAVKGKIYRPAQA